jgi:hypothetical protein
VGGGERKCLRFPSALDNTSKTNDNTQMNSCKGRDVNSSFFLVREDENLVRRKRRIILPIMGVGGVLMRCFIEGAV